MTDRKHARLFRCRQCYSPILLPIHGTFSRQLHGVDKDFVDRRSGTFDNLPKILFLSPLTTLSSSKFDKVIVNNLVSQFPEAVIQTTQISQLKRSNLLCCHNSCIAIAGVARLLLQKYSVSTMATDSSTPTPQPFERHEPGKFSTEETTFLKEHLPAYEAMCHTLEGKGPRGCKKNWVLKTVYPQYVKRFSSNQVGGPLLESLESVSLLLVVVSPFNTDFLNRK